MEFLSLAELDRSLLERCLARKPRAWEDFVDRFMGLVLHVIDHTSQVRGIRLTAEDRETFCARVFRGFAAADFRILREFRGTSALAGYLTVVARRIVVRSLLERLRDHAKGCPDSGRSIVTPSMRTATGAARG